MPNLVGLDVGHSLVDDLEPGDLAGFKKLSRLDLEKIGLTNAGLKELAGLTSLTSLSIGQNEITDAGLKELVPLKNLVSLDLGYNKKITDSGFNYGQTQEATVPQPLLHAGNRQRAAAAGRPEKPDLAQPVQYQGDRRDRIAQLPALKHLTAALDLQHGNEQRDERRAEEVFARL